MSLESLAYFCKLDISVWDDDFLSRCLTHKTNANTKVKSFLTKIKYTNVLRESNKNLSFVFVGCSSLRLRFVGDQYRIIY